MMMYVCTHVHTYTFNMPGINSGENIERAAVCIKIQASHEQLQLWQYRYMRSYVARPTDNRTSLVD